jgi:hypothetical protein
MTNRGVWRPLVSSVAWSAALIPGALLVPIEDPQGFAYEVHGKTIDQWISLTRGNGNGILWIPIVSLVLVLVAAYLLAYQSRGTSPVPWRVATGIGLVILSGALVGTVTFLVGAFLAPAAALDLVASGRSRHPQSLRRGSVQCCCGRENSASSRFCASCGEVVGGRTRLAANVR